MFAFLSLRSALSGFSISPSVVALFTLIESERVTQFVSIILVHIYKVLKLHNEHENIIDFNSLM